MRLTEFEYSHDMYEYIGTGAITEELADLALYVDEEGGVFRFIQSGRGDVLEKVCYTPPIDIKQLSFYELEELSRYLYNILDATQTLDKFE